MTTLVRRWFGLRCLLRCCPFQSNDTSYAPIGAHCTIAGCERQIIVETNWRGPWWRRRALARKPKEPANAA